MARRPRFIVSLEERPREGTSISLDTQNLHHLRNVLRASVGAEVAVFEKTMGLEIDCLITEIGSSEATLRVQQVAPARSAPPLTLILGRPKSSTLDFIVEKCTELGITRIIIFEAERSQGRGAARPERLRRIAESAFNQSRSTSFPEIQFAPDLPSALPDKTGLKLLLSPSAVRTITETTLGFFKKTPEPQRSLEDRTDCAELFLIVGPEGGLSEREEESARVQGYVPVSLSENILRAETAALVGVALVQLLRR